MITRVSGTVALTLAVCTLTPTAAATLTLPSLVEAERPSLSPTSEAVLSFCVLSPTPPLVCLPSASVNCASTLPSTSWSSAGAEPSSLDSSPPVALASASRLENEAPMARKSTLPVPVVVIDRLVVATT